MPVMIGQILGIGVVAFSSLKSLDQSDVQELIHDESHRALVSMGSDLLAWHWINSYDGGYLALQGHAEIGIEFLRRFTERLRRRNIARRADAQVELYYALHHGILRLEDQLLGDKTPSGSGIQRIRAMLAFMPHDQAGQAFISDDYRRILVEDAELSSEYFRRMTDLVDEDGKACPVWNFHRDSIGIDPERRPIGGNDRGAPRRADGGPVALARMDAGSVRDLDRAHRDAIKAQNDRIAPTHFGGTAKIKGLSLKKLYITLIADPTSSEEHGRARAIDAANRDDTGTSIDTWHDMLRPSPTSAVRRILNEQLSTALLPDRLVARPPERPKRHSDHPAVAQGTAEAATPEIQPWADGGQAAPESETIHGVLRRERYCVVLGDPGSGKTVLCQWIAGELAACRHQRKESAELGLARAPFLILARELIDQAGNNRVTSIRAYIETALRPDDSAASDGAWERYVAQLLDDGDAFVIIDGLDEVAVNYQGKLKRMIDAFADDHVARPELADVGPASGLGSQILITSRITGYYDWALNSERWSTFLIRPMPDAQIEQFCENWCSAAGFPSLAVALRAELFAPRNAVILSMARNPLLLSILCELGTRERTEVRLPRARSELYEQIVIETISGWRDDAAKRLFESEPAFDRGQVPTDALLALLAPVASHIHQGEITSEINGSELRALLIDSIARLEGKHHTQLNKKEYAERLQFSEIGINQVFGVLSERSRGRYSFLHRTFQEYLAGLFLLLPEPDGKALFPAPFDIPAALLADKIVADGLLLDSHWRQPLLLLFGQLALMQSQRAVGIDRRAPDLFDVIKELDERQRSDGSQLPAEEWALFLADILAELPETFFSDSANASDLITTVVAPLLDAYGGLGPARDGERARRLFAERLAGIRRQMGVAPFEQAVVLAMDGAAGGDRPGAAAHLILARAWLSQGFVDAFHARRHRDDARWNWSVHSLLRVAATCDPIAPLATPRQPFMPPPADQVRDMKRYQRALPAWRSLRLEWADRREIAAPLLPRDAHHIQRTLARASINESLGTPYDAIATLAALNGLGDHRARAHEAQYEEYVEFLALPDSARQAALDAEPWRYLPWFGADDTVYAIAVHLDTVGDGYRKHPAPRPEIRSIAATDGIAHFAAGAVAARRPVHAALGRINTRDLKPDERCALAVIARLTAPVDRRHSVALDDRRESGPMLKEAERLRVDFLDPCYRGVIAVQNWLGTQIEAVTPADWLLAHRTLASAWVQSGRLGGKFERRPVANLPNAHSPLGEHWAQGFAGQGDDARYVFALRLDEDWKPTSITDIQAMLRAVTSAHGLNARQIGLPDLLDLGAGNLPLPPIDFYEAVVALWALAGDRLGGDLADGWVSVALGPLIGVDPLGERYFRGYAPNEPVQHGRREWVSTIDSSLRGWRQIVDAMIFFGQSPAPDMLLAAWSRAWDECAGAGERLLLARDAMTLGLDDDASVPTRIRQLVARPARGWEIESALLAGQIARERTDSEWFVLGLHCLAAGGDPTWRAEVLRAFAPLIDMFAGEIGAGAVDKLIKTLGPRERCVAIGQPTQWLRSWLADRWPADESLRCSLASALIVAAANDEITARRRSPDALSAGHAWCDLADSLGATGVVGRGTVAVDALIDLAPSRGFALTESAARAFEIADRSHESAGAAVERLLPLIEHVPRTMLAKVQAWRDELGAAARMPAKFSRALRDHAILWFAEAERRFTAADIDALSRLIDEGDDRSAARARLVLHGAENWIGDRPHRYSLLALASDGAAETMERLGSKDVEGEEANRTGWAFARSLKEWRNDDPDVIGRWLARLTEAPDDLAMRRVVFGPWRWSADCLRLWSDWVSKIDDPALANESAVWLGVVHVAAADKLPDEFVPPLPDWPPDCMPDVEWLPRRVADGLVIKALSDANAAAADVEGASIDDAAAALALHAGRTMRENVRSLRAAVREGRAITSEDYLSLGNAATQTIGDVPETAWKSMSDTGWTDRQVTALTLWAGHCLDRWQANRRAGNRFDFYNEVLCVSLVSILACLFDCWPNTIRIAMKDPERDDRAALPNTDAPATGWFDLLVAVIRFFPNDRIAQAAWMLLGGIVGPDTRADRIWEALVCSLRAEPIIRDRALATLSSIEGRALVKAIGPSIDDALKLWDGETRGQSILAMAQLFAMLAREPLLDRAERRKIQSRLKAIVGRASSRRPLFRIVGGGSKSENSYRIVGEGMLDEKLREIERELLIDLM